MHTLRWSIGLGALVLVSGCPMAVTVGNPQPDIELKAQRTTLRLDASGVQDAFSTPANSQVAASVSHFQQTLQNGFHNGFGDAFQLVNDPPAELTVKLVNVSLTYALATDSPDGFVAHISYDARLIDGHGKELRVSRHAVTSMEATQSRHDATLAATKAVETMYELAARDLLDPNAPSVKDPGALVPLVPEPRTTVTRATLVGPPEPSELRPQPRHHEQITQATAAASTSASGMQGCITDKDCPSDQECWPGEHTCKNR